MLKMGGEYYSNQVLELSLVHDFERVLAVNLPELFVLDGTATEVK